MLDRPGEPGPVQVVVIGFDGGSFDGGVLDELLNLRAEGAVRLIDLMFVAKDGQGEVIELESGHVSTGGDPPRGELIRALFGADATAANGSPVARGGVWFLADAVPSGTAAAVALLEHRWAVPLREAIESAPGHDLADRWIHREDLPTVGADPG